MSLEHLNRYVLVSIALSAVLLYLAIVLVGFAELVARMPDRSNRQRRPGSGRNARRLRNAKKSI